MSKKMKKKIDRVVNKTSARSRKRIHELRRQNKIIGEIVFATIAISGAERSSKLEKLL